MTKPQSEAERMAEEYLYTLEKIKFDRQPCKTITETYLAGFKAAVEQAEKILKHGCGEAPVQFTYEELRTDLKQLLGE